MSGDTEAEAYPSPAPSCFFFAGEGGITYPELSEGCPENSELGDDINDLDTWSPCRYNTVQIKLMIVDHVAIKLPLPLGNTRVD